MLPSRRAVLAAAASSIVAPGVKAAADAGAPVRDIRAIAFDAFAVFDPRSVALLADELFPGKGAELSNLWRARQFDYSWLRALSQRYADFWQVTSDALIFAAKASRLDLTEDKRARLMQAHLELKPWPDAVDALRRMKQSRLRLVFLSNFTRQMLQANAANSGMEGMFELLLSTDAVQTFKPDRRAYQLGIDALKLQRSEILFVAFAGWDAAGAKSFGYETFWTNRQNLPIEELDSVPDFTGSSLAALIDVLRI
jgi:2-haloacid dehalogenase